MGPVEGPPGVRAAETLVGRGSELEILTRFIEGSGTAGLVLHGDAGIGKTALWRAGLSAADDRGLHVLSTRASEGETGLLFAGLADLVEGVAAGVFDRVPPAQAHALDVALRRALPAGEPPDPLAVYSGFLAAVRVLAEAAPVLVAIDDVQWLDPSSAECLLFTARRVRPPEVRFLLSSRGSQPTGLERVIEHEGVERIRLGAMSLGAIGRMLTERTQLVAPRRVLRQVYEVSQGNPLFALELGRTLHEFGLPEPGSELPTPKLVGEAFGDRVRALPDRLRRLLLAVSLSSNLAVGDLAAFADEATIDDAVRAALVELDRGGIVPAHPMLAAAARSQSTSAERQEVHLLLAGAVSDPVLSARHLALATPGPDEEVAATLEAAARIATSRAAVHEAVELAALSLRLTPAGSPEAVDRTIELARCHWRSGDGPAAESVLSQALESLPAGRPRASAHLLLGQVGDGATHFPKAMSEAGDDMHLRGVALASMSSLLSIILVERLEEAEALAREGLACLTDSPEQDRARTALAWALVMRGQDPGFLDDAGAVSPGAGPFNTMIERPVAVRHGFRGDLEMARRLFRRVEDTAREYSDPRSWNTAAIQHCEMSLRQGDVGEAEAILATVDLQAPIVATIENRLNALIAALRGHTDEARRLCKTILDSPQAGGLVPTWDRLEARRALGLVAILEGDHRTASEYLGSVWEHCRREGIEDPGAFPVAGDLVEALVETGDDDRAVEVKGWLEALTRRQEHPWGGATVTRCRALVASGSGRADPAVAGLVDAAAAYAALGLEFESARCLLFAGRIQRRSKMRGAARQALEEAESRFRGLGCGGWADLARAELARVSGRRAQDGGELTASERQAAALAAQGMSNKEIAASLYVSVNTVEVHLSRAYAKLGVRSRSQLADRLREG